MGYRYFTPCSAGLACAVFLPSSRSLSRVEYNCARLPRWRSRIAGPLSAGGCTRGCLTNHFSSCLSVGQRRLLTAAFPDFHMTVGEVIAQGDKVSLCHRSVLPCALAHSERLVVCIWSNRWGLISGRRKWCRAGQR